MDPVTNLNLTRYEDESNQLIYHYIWEAPFSLNITDIEPDIAYCVLIYTVTCPDQETVVHVCNVTIPRYTIQARRDELYKIEVRPRIYSDGASNGTEVEYEGLQWLLRQL